MSPITYSASQVTPSRPRRRLLASAIVALLISAAADVANISCERAHAHAQESAPAPGEPPQTLETMTFADDQGLVHEEYAFREPLRGLPDHVLQMFCSSVKLRLYWDVYRDEIKGARRKGIYLRRMARLTRHFFEEVRDVDKPFNATMLSLIDEYFGVKLDAVDKKLDKAIEGGASTDQAHGPFATSTAALTSSNSSDEAPSMQRFLMRPRSMKQKLCLFVQDSKSKLKSASNTQAATQGSRQQHSFSEAIDEIESSDTIKDLESEGNQQASKRIKTFAKNWGPKFALAVYTRWRTMWWLMMSCLFTKYYLWDPALDEFTKLKRSLVMWPQLQLLRMQDLQCKPLMFFKRLMDTCKVLNPLMRFDFGQFNLDKLTRFKSDID